MIPTHRTKLFRASACVSDLRENGIDLAALGPSALNDFVQLNLDYFRCMLGYDAAARHVVSLIRRAEAPPPGGNGGPRPPVPGRDVERRQAPRHGGPPGAAVPLSSGGDDGGKRETLRTVAADRGGD